MVRMTLQGVIVLAIELEVPGLEVWWVFWIPWAASGCNIKTAYIFNMFPLN